MAIVGAQVEIRAHPRVGRHNKLWRVSQKGQASGHNKGTPSLRRSASEMGLLSHWCLPYSGDGDSTG